MLKNRIYNYFLSNETKKQHEVFSVAPSYFNDCKRKLYYKKTGEPVSNPIEEASYFKMALGSAGHEKIQDIIGRLDSVKMIECEDLKRIEWNDLLWFYRLDGIIEINNKKYILEIKTIYGVGFRDIEKNGPKEDHLLQAYLYMQFEDIKDCVILYVGRDNGFMLEFVYQEHQLEGIKEKVNNQCKKLRILEENINFKTLPDRDFQIQAKNTGVGVSEDFTKDKVKYKSHWRCNYCSYKNTCWSDVYAELGNHKFYINNEYID